MAEATPGIWTVPHFLNQRECDPLIARAEAAGFKRATINAQGRAVIDTGVRNNDRVILDDEELADGLWWRIREHLPAFLSGRQAIGLNERFRFYRYEPGQQFKGHTDGAYLRTNGQLSLLTFMIYLNEGYLGGETAFATKVVEPQCGLALLFHHDIFHEGREVLQGKKYVLRSDVMFNPIGRLSG